ncbi:MAG: 4Fe-4S binding protein, partial [Myxococcales bacterium]|nr:4Fe-4S binding protein [Myxococcales bacterium]
MSVLSSAGLWFRHLFGAAPIAPPPHPGRALLSSGGLAALRIEAMGSDRLAIAASRLEPLGLVTEGAEGETLRLREGGAEAGALFTAHPLITRQADAPAAFAAAAGACLAGRRAAVFAPSAALESLEGPLRRAATQHLPLVLHILDEGDGAWMGANLEAMPVLLVARDAQHSADLTLLCRWLAERVLLPVVLVHEGGGASFAEARAPEPALLREFLGAPSDPLEPPTPAQRMIFGEHRPRVPRLFDLDRVLSLGGQPEGPDRDLVGAGQALFFEAHLKSLLDEGFETLSAQIGRPLSALSVEGSPGARQLLLAAGGAIPLAEAIRQKLRYDRAGVLGLQVIRPFPADALRLALKAAQRITILEPRIARGRLLHALEALTRAERVELLEATTDGPSPRSAELAALFEQMGARAPTPSVRLGANKEPGASRFPKREALVDRIQRDYPALRDSTLSASTHPDLRPEGARTLLFAASEGPALPGQLERLGALLGEPFGPHLRGRLLRSGAGRITAANQGFEDPLEGVPLDAIVLSGAPTPTVDLEDMAQGARIFLALPESEDGLDANAIWAGLPETLRALVRSKDAGLWAGRADLETLLDAAPALLQGEPPSGLMPIDWEALEEPSRPASPALPASLRTLGEGASPLLSLPRFFAEQLEPSLLGDRDRLPDPFLSFGGTPPLAAALVGTTAHRARLPAISNEGCDGCGRCWTSCPHGAIAISALPTQALLDTAASLGAAQEAEGEAGAQTRAARDKLRRAHRQLANLVDAKVEISAERTLSGALVGAAFETLLNSMGPEASEREQLETAFEATRAGIESLPVALTPRFFHEPQAKQSGTGEALLLAIDPGCCEGCGACAEVCEPGAIEILERDPTRVARAAARWRAWEQTKDTSGATIARAAGADGIGPMAASLMSRHVTLGTLQGAEGAEPGSGERAALRLVLAAMEEGMQRRFLGRLHEIEALEKKLRAKLDDLARAAIPTANLEALHEALVSVPDHPSNVRALLGSLDAQGERASVDRGRLETLVETLRSLQELRTRLAGQAGQPARARIGLIVAGGGALEWATRACGGPFGAPMIAADGIDAAAIASGLMESLLADHAEEVSLIRYAEQLASASSSARIAARRPGELRWRELSEEELASLPAMLIVTDGEQAASALAELSRLLSGDLPIWTLVLDDPMPGESLSDAMHAALGHRHAFVLSSSISHPDHLFEGIAAGLAHRGPGLLRVLAPSPRREQLAPDQARRSAAHAVECRVYPLLRYDPGQEGGLSGRLSLEGNPAPAEPFFADPERGPLTPAHWAAAQPRLSTLIEAHAPEGPGRAAHEWAALPRQERERSAPTLALEGKEPRGLHPRLAALMLERFERWATLQELAALRSPQVQVLRQQAEREALEQAKAEREALEAAHRAEIAKLEQTWKAEEAQRLKARL